MKTTTLKKSEFKKEWHLLDATNISVGRLASRVSLILKGKNKPQYSPNLPVGDGVIIINTDNCYILSILLESSSSSTKNNLKACKEMTFSGQSWVLSDIQN